MIDTKKTLTPSDGFKYLVTKEYPRGEATNTLTSLYITFTKAMFAHIEENQSADIQNELFFLGECILILTSNDIDVKLNDFIEYYDSPQYIAAYLFRAYSRYSRIIAKYPNEYGGFDDIENELLILSQLIEVFNAVYEADTEIIAG